MTPSATGSRYYEPFLQLGSPDPEVFERASDQIRANWQPNHLVLLVEATNLSPNRKIMARNAELLNELSGRKLPTFKAAFRHVWTELDEPPHGYASFKAEIYKKIDPSFERYFQQASDRLIRLDEIRWGGVRRDGIPPLVKPKMLKAEQADYLADTDVVFGLSHRGDVRAYPQRILAWHEMFRDEVGGEPLNGVYCTLCGSMIVYRETFRGVHHQLGTSGFLYRSNKLMYDQKTRSLWSTLEGKPVVGPLVDQGIELEQLWVVTTTWGAWKKRHPETTVLSLETGHTRDYSEGAAYRAYFATDKLMFNVPETDTRLKNKDEVLALREDEAQVAISVAFLSKHPVHYEPVGDVGVVVLTDSSGANRAYHAPEVRLLSYDGSEAKDADGKAWKVHESKLVGPDGLQAQRFPAHRAFWFGWRAAFPETRLVK